VRIEVLDTGVGIPRDQLSHIFDEFYQVGVSPNTARDGYGLGLSIVDRLVRLLDVELDVQSEVGKGSRFAFALPAGAAPGAGAATAATRATGPARASARHVLLVEDDAGVRDATRMLLRVEGYQVTTAGSLDEALEKSRGMRAPPDLVVTDYHLGSGETGVQVIAALREATGQDIKAVLVSGDTSSAMRALGRDHRLRVVSKPIEPEEFMAIVGELTKPL
jgi:CheY-like chemotaxis protein